MAYGKRPPGCPPEIDAIETYGECWPKDAPFPLTAEEALWVLKGYEVRPRSGPIDIETYDRLPGRFELSDGAIVLHRS